MKLAIASDHGGFELKDRLRAHLAEEGHEVTDFGPANAERADYPDYAGLVARAVASGAAERGVLVCGSGIGMSMAANKIAGVRAAVVQDVEHARLAREHNDANVLCLGGRFTAFELATAILDAWLDAECTGDRHGRRIAKIHALES
ncbi:MAG: ribose 5-phosphate isomerase B [Myxococcota bacterium]|jgi:ribose 5-phosphate isomerase B